MLVEHTFITTLSAPDTQAAAANLLGGRGFQIDLSATPAANDGALHLRRGRMKATSAKSILELPQEARVEWDRGRVNVAISISPRMWMGRQYPPGAWRTVSAKRPSPDQQSLLIAIAHALEMHLAHRATPEESYKVWDILEQRLDAEAKVAQRRRKVSAVILLVIVLGLIGLMVYALSGVR